MIMILVEAALRSLLLALAVGGVLHVARVRNPQVEMTAWITVLAAALGMPILMQWRLWHLPAPVVILPHQFLGAMLHGTAGIPAEPLPPVPPLPPGEPWSPAESPKLLPLILPAVYGMVTAVLLLRLATGLLVTAGIVRAARPIRGAWTRGADVRVSARIWSPVTFGRTVLLPASFIGWNAAKRRAVLSHELSHVAHRDFLVQVLSQLHATIFWFSPLAWWLQRRLAALAETTSDEAAIAELGDRVDYAAILLDIASGGGRLPTGIAMARPALLGARVERILGEGAPLIELAPRVRLLLAASLLPAALLIGGTSWRAGAALPSLDMPAGASVTAAVPSFAIRAGGRDIVSGSGADLDRLLAARDTYDKALLFLRDGKLYAVTAPDVVSEAADLFEVDADAADQSRELTDAEREIGESQAEIGRRQAAVGQQMSAVAARYSARIAAEASAAAAATGEARAQAKAARAEAQAEFKAAMAELVGEQKQLAREQEQFRGQQSRLSARQKQASAGQGSRGRDSVDRLMRLADRAMARGTATVVP